MNKKTGNSLGGKYSIGPAILGKMLPFIQVLRHVFQMNLRLLKTEKQYSNNFDASLRIKST